jgi:hypothetical protein
MPLYHFSPIKSQDELLEAIKYIHFACHKLCVQAFGQYLPNSGNVGVFCHYESEFEYLKGVRQEWCEPSDNRDQKYFKLREAIVIPEERGVPETTYEYLYIRRPNPNSPQVGDIDFYLEQEKYDELKQSLLVGKVIKGARVFDRQDLDMIELYDPDVDAVAYVSTEHMTKTVRTKQSDITKL